MTNKFQVPASGAVWGLDEKNAMCDQIHSGWLTAGKKNKQFERELAARWKTDFATTCNSGSSANLLAVTALVEAGIWKAGDEIVTTATSFPTTVNPLIQNRLVPVFTDIELESCNATISNISNAVSSKTRGIMLAHTLGHPFHPSIADLAEEADLALIEDCCDAFGAGWSDGTQVGTRGSLATCSFFPAHHITTGEGGAVFTSDYRLKRIVESLSSWGRDCYCDPGEENCCGKRFDHTWDGMPYGYDHKYTYSHMGYNLKMTEIQAVCGLEQLKKIDDFVQKRNSNWQYLKNRLMSSQEHLFLPVKQNWAVPSWFGFVITIRRPGERAALQEYLAEKGIGSRLLFGGNIIRQPYMKDREYRVSGSLLNSNKVMEDSLWIGCWPGLTEPMLDYTCETIESFFA